MEKGEGIMNNNNNTQEGINNNEEGIRGGGIMRKTDEGGISKEGTKRYT